MTLFYPDTRDISACPMIAGKLRFDITCKLFGPVPELPRFTKLRYLGAELNSIKSGAFNITFSH